MRDSRFDPARNRQNFNDVFADFDTHFANTQRTAKRFAKIGAAVWVVMFLAGLGLTGVLVWAVIALVQHITG